MSNLKIFTDNIEQEAIDQINTLIAQDAFKDCKIRIMPDCHSGKGCVIGFTANLGDKVIPNIVGVDIGCGMLTTLLATSDIDLAKLDTVIRQYIPSGRDIHTMEQVLFPKLEELKCYSKLKGINRIKQSIGTLGGGNHFIEIDRDEGKNLFLVVHTGSRNLGKQVADYYQRVAEDKMCGKGKILEEINELIDRYKAEGRESEIANGIREIYNRERGIPKELCYLTGQDREDYLFDMKICQEYASLNRLTITDIILEKMEISPLHIFETVHNYIDKDNIVRKGAISAKHGEEVLIPMNMRDGCIIGLGKGNEDWNMSAPHGAGRLMSRTKAKSLITLEEFKNSMEGIFTTSVVTSTIDEAPMAYKPTQEIIDNIGDTVDIISIIKPIYNFKASE